MWFFRFAIILLEFLFIFYYTAVVFQLLDVWKITNRKITWKAIRKNRDKFVQNYSIYNSCNLFIDIINRLL